MYRLENVVQPYSWGSRKVISELLGRPTPSTTPEAELWMGDHPAAPSQVLLPGGAKRLPDAIAANPADWLGEAAVARFGPRLPFLLKVLAAEQPLSLQAHPDHDQARDGFAREEAAGVPIGAPERTYKDASGKPELICALTPFEALCGFRPAREVAGLLERVGGVPAGLENLHPAPEDHYLRTIFARLLEMESGEASKLVARVIAGCERLCGEGGAGAEASKWALELGRLYPGDVGVIASLMLEYIRLEPGEALFLAPRSPHAYLRGSGIEVMASSDNVLRGGLTPKFVNVPELLRVLDFRSSDYRAHASEEGGERVYGTPAHEFRLSRLVVGEAPREVTVGGPEIVLCTEGHLGGTSRRGEAVDLPRGASAIVPAGAKSYRLEGRGIAFRATVGR